jgi:hypothetical protein
MHARKSDDAGPEHGRNRQDSPLIRCKETPKVGDGQPHAIARGERDELGVGDPMPLREPADELPLAGGRDRLPGAEPVEDCPGPGEGESEATAEQEIPQLRAPGPSPAPHVPGRAPQLEEVDHEGQEGHLGPCEDRETEHRSKQDRAPESVPRMKPQRGGGEGQDEGGLHAAYGEQVEEGVCTDREPRQDRDPRPPQPVLDQRGREAGRGGVTDQSESLGGDRQALRAGGGGGAGERERPQRTGETIARLARVEDKPMTGRQVGGKPEGDVRVIPVHARHERERQRSCSGQRCDDRKGGIATRPEVPSSPAPAADRMKQRDHNIF